jgi:hypothetical protein
MIFLLVAIAWLSGGCRNEAASAFPTSTPIPVYTPWSLLADVGAPASTPTAPSGAFANGADRTHRCSSADSHACADQHARAHH